ncbi:MAG: type II 3-dehydroquinate dehydratase [Candidatus Omnitrophota bacterium]|jgi:3-dehydroquinate dehydratase-2
MAEAKKVLVIHGPNLALLGRREPAVYGKGTLRDINSLLKQTASKRNARLSFLQSDHEGEIVERIGAAAGKFDAILINPAAYTHTSVAIRDALSATGLPSVEIHLSNVYSREQFRNKSLISPVVSGTVSGFGANSYRLGLEALLDILQAE